MDHEKTEFISNLQRLCTELPKNVSTEEGHWTIKGFIDTYQNIYTISSDTKIISKILETQLLPYFHDFAESFGYEVVQADQQNWYPDLSFIKKSDAEVKFAVDIKTTYHLDGYEDFCNGFTLGSYGEYFRDHSSLKNIQFPYGSYKAHIILGIIYKRTPITNTETEVLNISNLASINSVISDFLFFAQEKWKIASDKQGSGNTKNIGSINYIPDILSGNGVFVNLGEKIFDEYWTNRLSLKVPDSRNQGKLKELTRLSEFLEFKKMDKSLINSPKTKSEIRSS